MKTNSYIREDFAEKIPSLEGKGISYSEYSEWSKCQLSWKYKYVDKQRSAPSIHMLFGTAMHECIQHFVTVYYNQTIPKALDLNLNQMLLDNMKKLYVENVEKSGSGWTTQQEFKEVYIQGTQILDWIKKHSKTIFFKKGWELIGIEMPIFHQISPSVPMKMKGFIDLVLYDRDAGRYLIIDIKTSKQGWNKYQKSDKVKISQLVIYKEYFAKEYGVDVKSIDIQFLILKRTLWEETPYVQKHVQIFEPAHGSVTMNRVRESITKFVEEAYDAEGKPRVDIPLQARQNGLCQFCQFNNEEQCPVANRVTVKEPLVTVADGED